MIDLHHGDCLDIMPTLEADSVDTVICDPPYGLSFMGKDWDHGIPGVRFWREALRVAKPGAMLLAFGGTRTFHRLAVAIEDAGWIFRDTIMFVYGSGFPKSHDISKAIDKAAGAERETVGVSYRRNGTNGENKGLYQQAPRGDTVITAPATPAAETWHGWGTALKPAWEPVIVAMKPLDGTFAQNALQHGVAGLWIDGARVGTEDNLNGGAYSNGAKDLSKATSYATGVNAGVYTQPSGRWPANLIHDGSAEVLAGFPYSKDGVASPNGAKTGMFPVGNRDYSTGYGGEGSAARFFYCAKASRSERNAGLEGMEARHVGTYAQDEWSRQNMGGKPDAKREPVQNHHPTVKPIALMRYLARLTKTPTGGVVLDPFMGSGSTGIGAVMEGRDFIGIEQDADYIEIARRRIEHWAGQPRQEELLK